MPPGDSPITCSQLVAQDKRTAAHGPTVLAALKNIPPVLHFVWESGPAVVFWNIALRIVVAFLPVAIGIIVR